MKNTILLALLIFGLFSCQEQPKTKTDNIRDEILQKGRSIVWALNEGNVDSLMNQYWQSDSALFMINGRQIKGYDQIKGRLIESIKYRNKMELEAQTEDVLIHSPTSATHLVQFTQAITDLNDSVSYSQGLWTAVYQKMDGEWKTVFVHESYYPTDGN